MNYPLKTGYKNIEKTILIIGGLILVLQLICFSDYISPFHWAHLKVSGQACTCPDEKVLGGRLYLRSITPDSLKKYDPDYSEIYVTEKPASAVDPMGADLYIIEGKVIGKMRVDEHARWNLMFRIDRWREVDIVKYWVVKSLFLLQLVFLLFLMLKSKRNTIKKA